MVYHNVQFIERPLIQRVHRRVGDVHRRHLRATRECVVLHTKIAIPLEQLLIIAQLLASPPFIDCGLQFADRLRIAQCAHVAHVAAFHQRPHHPAHILPAARLGELCHLDKIAGHCHGALVESHQLREPALVVLGQRATGGRLHKREWRVSLFAMRRTNHDHVSHRRHGIELTVPQNRTFDLLRAHAMTRHVDHIIAAPVQ